MSQLRKPLADAFTAAPQWSREQTLLAFQFYCLTPFGKLDSRNKKLIELAGLIGRTPGALAMKCVNIASLDPNIRESGRKGLSNASALDREVWDEFHANWDRLVEECEALRSYLLGESVKAIVSPAVRETAVAVDFSGETRKAVVEQRVKHDFFRRAVLSGYGYKCCISGVSDQRLLIASHIVPWSEDSTIRLHPGNGLCLSAIHDSAFDNHLFSLTDDYQVVLSRQLRATKDKFLRDVFFSLEDTQISLPDKFVPEQDFVRRHRHRMAAADTKESAQ
ncbi:MAG: HNH endonuclease [Burkholderiales bacterium]